jgi:hypothetical protein
MKNVIWLAVGVALGFLTAHFAARTPAGSAFFGAIDGRVTAATSGFLSGYRGRAAELRAAAADSRLADGVTTA